MLPDIKLSVPFMIGTQGTFSCSRLYMQSCLLDFKFSINLHLNKRNLQNIFIEFIVSKERPVIWGSNVIQKAKAKSWGSKDLSSCTTWMMWLLQGHFTSLILISLICRMEMLSTYLHTFEGKRGSDIKHLTHNSKCLIK